MSIHRRIIRSLHRGKDLLRVGAAAALILGTSLTHGQNFPSGPVTIVLPYPASQVDSFTRLLAKGLADEWHQPVLVDNRPGANEIIAADRVTKARPDGLTLFLGTEAAYLLNPLLYRKLPYSPSQLTPVSMLVRAPLVLVVRSTLPVSTLKDFVEFARGKGSQGVSYGSPGVGGLGHLPFVALSRDQGINLLHVPYRGGSAVMADLIAGHVDASLMGPGITDPEVKVGRIKALAISSDRRSPVLPNVPTFEELGVKDIGASYFLGLSVPAGTPQAIVDKIAADSRKVVSTQAFKDTMLDPFGFTLIASTPVEFANQLTIQQPVWQQRVKDSGVQLDMQ